MFVLKVMQDLWVKKKETKTRGKFEKWSRIAQIGPWRDTVHAYVPLTKHVVSANHRVIHRNVIITINNCHVRYK